MIDDIRSWSLNVCL